VQKLQVARRELDLEAAIDRLDRFHLLILDDLAYVTKDQAETSVLFEFISALYERRSMLVTANRPFGEWGEGRSGSRNDARRDRSPCTSRDAFAGSRACELTEVNMVCLFRCVDAMPSIPKEVPMRILALAILAIGTVSIGPAAAQTYDPAYPVCLHVYGRGATITNAATPRCLSATRRPRAGQHSASSIHISRARKGPQVIGGILASTEYDLAACFRRGTDAEWKCDDRSWQILLQNPAAAKRELRSSQPVNRHWNGSQRQYCTPNHILWMTPELSSDQTTPTQGTRAGRIRCASGAHTRAPKRPHARFGGGTRLQNCTAVLKSNS
jgi:IstB-like ATP binding protein